MTNATEQLTPAGVTNAPRRDAQLAGWIEQAAHHQLKATYWLHRAADPGETTFSLAKRRALLFRALDHVLVARHLLHNAREASTDAATWARLQQHLSRLDRILAGVECRFADVLDLASDSRAGRRSRSRNTAMPG
jgi:hypothetical protein